MHQHLNARLTPRGSRAPLRARRRRHASNRCRPHAGTSRHTAHEPKGTACAFMARALEFYEGLGVRIERVMTDNGPAYRSGDFNEMLGARGIGQKHARSFSPWQNGKVEQMNRTLAQEWRYARARGSEAERDAAPPRLH